MMDYLIIGAIALVIALVIALLRKRAGRKGCCGSAGDYRAKEKKLKNVICTRKFRINGMHCEKCSNRVMEVINDIAGAAARVDLKSAIATVEYDREVDDQLIISRLARAGYDAQRME